MMNADFSNRLHEDGHSYLIDGSDTSRGDVDMSIPLPSPAQKPVHLCRSQAFSWVKNVVDRNRGRELAGNFNPLLVGELFWQQSVKWKSLAEVHVEEVAEVCRRFLTDLLEDMCPKDVISRLWSFHIEEALKERIDAADGELQRIVDDQKGYPINYNHNYTDLVRKSQKEREFNRFAEAVDNATTHNRLPGCHSDHTSAKIDIHSALDGFNGGSEPDMEKTSCEDALDRLQAIYTVSAQLYPIVCLTYVKVRRSL
jgi:hypothetical protein